jgi:outer membrane lipoprotein-sorting protein
MESLQETYAIELLPSGADLAEDHVHLRMIPDANALPDHEYRSVHVWLDQETWLPVKVEAESLDEDIYRLHFVALKLNQPIDAAAFEVRIPAGFGTPEVVPLN